MSLEFKVDGAWEEMAQLGSVLAVRSWGVLCEALGPSCFLSFPLEVGDVRIKFLKYSAWFYNNTTGFLSGMGPWFPISGWFVNSLGSCAEGGNWLACQPCAWANHGEVCAC